MSSSSDGRHIAVIGAGIVGVCSALSLQREGFRVTLIDRDGPGEGASFGNGAIFGEEAVVTRRHPGRALEGALAAQLGALVPLETERGYHVQFPEPDVAPRLPVFTTERAFVATPLEIGLRCAGTVELGGLEAPPNWARAEILARHARRWFPGLRTEGATRWMGFRPSMPDSLPIIGRSPRFSNVFLAFGHGHCGMILGARSGALVAAMAADRDPGLDMTPYRADRF